MKHLSQFAQCACIALCLTTGGFSLYLTLTTDPGAWWFTALNLGAGIAAIVTMPPSKRNAAR